MNRGRRCPSAIAGGRRTERGRCSCGGSRPRRTRPARSTGTSRPTRRLCAHTTTPLAPSMLRRQPSKGALSPDGQSRSGPVGTHRPAGKGGAGVEALGRSRGGFTTKIYLSADGRCRVLSLAITPGPCADCTQLESVMGRLRVPRLTCGRPRTKPDSVSADRPPPSRKGPRKRGRRAGTERSGRRKRI